MSRSFRLTRRAESSLVELAIWTLQKFGPQQAEIYEAELLERCADVAAGRAHSRSCSVLVDEAADLLYVRAGEHFLVFLEDLEQVVIVDILHARSDLPRHIESLVTLKETKT